MRGFFVVVFVVVCLVGFNFSVVFLGVVLICVRVCFDISSHWRNVN